MSIERHIGQFFSQFETKFNFRENFHNRGEIFFMEQEKTDSQQLVETIQHRALLRGPANLSFE